MAPFCPQGNVILHHPIPPCTPRPSWGSLLALQEEIEPHPPKKTHSVHSRKHPPPQQPRHQKGALSPNCCKSISLLLPHGVVGTPNPRGMEQVGGLGAVWELFWEHSSQAVVLICYSASKEMGAGFSLPSRRIIDANVISFHSSCWAREQMFYCCKRTHGTQKKC